MPHDLSMFKFIITFSLVGKAHKGEDIPKVLGWTLLPPSPRPLILGMDFTLHFRPFHQQKFSKYSLYIGW
jgi:hypothetical protein